MFKYTPKKSVLRDMKVSHTPGTAWWDKEFTTRMAILKKYHTTQNGMMSHILANYYPNVCHYSKNQLHHVPVNGYLFPVSMFDEEVIDK